ncbi:hypothetical protein K1J50_17000, partial [Caldovatus sp. SYSU G05006]|nr:hypothetical protein [Caldovatus aquaticus]
MFDALPSRPRRRARGLTAEDRALWQAFVARSGVVPLRRRAAAEEAPASAPAAAAPAAPPPAPPVPA